MYLLGCVKIHLSSIHSSLALPGANVVSCGALLVSSLLSPQPALCSKGLSQYTSWPTPARCTVLTARIALVMHSSTLQHAVLLCSPVCYLSHTNCDHSLKGRHPSGLLFAAASPTLHDTGLSLCLSRARFLSHCCSGRTARGGSNAV